LDVTVITPDPPADDPSIVIGSGLEPAVVERARVEEAVRFVAGTDNDTTNLSLIAIARRVNPAIFVAARQNRRASAPLFASMDIDSLLVPPEVVAYDVYAQLSTPLLWRFLHEMPALGDAWAAQLVDCLIELCGRQLQALWKVRLTTQDAPALSDWLTTNEVHLGELLRNPEDQSEPLRAVPLLVLRGNDSVLGPSEDFVLAPDDEILLVGWPEARRALETTLVVDATCEYVMTGRHVPSSWLWRRIAPGREVVTRR
jgi:voltage-gated potassium channel